MCMCMVGGGGQCEWEGSVGVEPSLSKGSVRWDAAHSLSRQGLITALISALDPYNASLSGASPHSHPTHT